MDSLLAAAVRIGIDVNALHEAAQGEMRHEGDALQRYLVAARRLSGDDTVALSLAGALDIALVSPVVYLMLSSSNLKYALQSLIDYGGLLIGRRSEIRPSWSHGDLTVTYGEPGNSCCSDFMGAFTIRLCRFAVNDETLHPVDACFTRTRPLNTYTYEKFFGGSVRFDQPVNSMTWTATQLSIVSRHACHELYAAHSAIVHRQYQDLIEQVVVREVRRRLAAELSHGIPTLNTLSRFLGLTPRTLQRYLRSHGTDFQTVVDDLRKDRALKLVRDVSVPLSRIHKMLGFSSTSTFNRAFRKWVGTAPADVRREAQSEPAG